MSRSCVSVWVGLTPPGEGSTLDAPTVFRERSSGAGQCGVAIGFSARQGEIPNEEFEGMLFTSVYYTLGFPCFFSFVFWKKPASSFLN